MCAFAHVFASWSWFFGPSNFLIVPSYCSHDRSCSSVLEKVSGRASPKDATTIGRADGIGCSSWRWSSAFASSTDFRGAAANFAAELVYSIEMNRAYDELMMVYYIILCIGYMYSSACT